MRITGEMGNLAAWEKRLFYMCSARPTLHPRALFSDVTSDYRNPAEPVPGDEVTIRLRTGRYNVDKAYLVVDNVEHVMTRVRSESMFDYYEAKINVGTDKIYYYFKVELGRTVCYYNQIGAIKDLNPYYNFQITPGFKTPEWAKGAVMYQIFVDRFYNGDKSNDVLDDEYNYIGEHVCQVKDWNKYPAQMGIREFYGGDLKGVLDKLDYLEQLGIEVIYFNPLFVSPSNHKYDIQDYDYIDPHFGVIVDDEGEVLREGDTDNTHATRYISRVTRKSNLEASNDFFAKVVQEIHSRGMKVIIDGVFNHCGSFNKWLDKEHIYRDSADEYAPGAYERYESPYHNFFKFYSNQWPDNNSYDGWWGHDTLPKLNYEGSKELYDYILRIGKKWVSAPYNVDGWRLDVAAELGHSIGVNHQFWKDFRKSVKKANPEAIILAEHYGDPSSWMRGDQWDTVMNYDAFMEPITWFLTGMEKHSDEFQAEWYGNGDKFFRTMEHNMSKFQRQSLDVAMNELSNHDHSRFLTRTNSTVGRIATKGAKAANENVEKCILREAVVMQMTWPGAPTVYYGDEAGMVGWTDPDNRRSYPWGKQDWELIEFHKDMIRIHKKYECFRSGSYKSIASGSHWICYGRFNKKLQAVILINNRRETLTVDLPIWQIGILENACLKRVIQTTQSTYNVGEVMERAEDGILHVTVGPQTASVYIAAKNVEEN